ncbi:MAG: alpha/beta hydrolase [Chloroflexota bacterium]|nr:alpha/beta hydrolase [Chloroflexota bacterium]
MVSMESQQIRTELLASRGNATPLSIEEARRAWEDAVENANRSVMETVAPVDLDGVPGEWVAPHITTCDGAMLFFHGGGYNAGSCRTHRALAARLARAAGVPILLVDYRLAPEHPCPAAVQDAMVAYRWLLRHGFAGRQLVLGGDSAGAGLALAALVGLRDDGDEPPAGAYLISPWVDLSLTGPSFLTHADLDPTTTHKALSDAAQLYLGERAPTDPVASPLHADLSGLPPLLIQVGGLEILQCDATRLAERATLAGVEHQLEVWDEMWHVWHAWAESFPEARAAICRIGAFVRQCLRLKPEEG